MKVGDLVRARSDLFTDKDAVSKAREFMIPFPPSSPCIALFKDGEVVHMLERHHIEGRSAEAIAANLMAAFDEFC